LCAQNSISSPGLRAILPPFLFASPGVFFPDPSPAAGRGSILILLSPERLTLVPLSPLDVNSPASTLSIVIIFLSTSF